MLRPSWGASCYFLGPVAHSLDGMSANAFGGPGAKYRKVDEGGRKRQSRSIRRSIKKKKAEWSACLYFAAMLPVSTAEARTTRLYFTASFIRPGDGTCR